jgi:enolase
VQITALKARQIFDSRGTPTVEADLIIDGKFLGRAAVPSGASKGRYEALEKRDGGKAFNGNGVLNAVEIINNKIFPYLLQTSCSDQAELDKFLINLDGTENKSNFGANALLAVSVAYAKAVAEALNKPLFSTIGGAIKKIPTPMLNIINGGVHADNGLSIQEFMIVPKRVDDIRQNLRIAAEVYQELKNILRAQSYKTNTGDEGGFAPELDDTATVLEYILQAIEQSGYKPGVDVCLALDCAANEFYSQDGYCLNRGKDVLSTAEMVNFYADLCEKYPIVSIEDPFAEDDHLGWQQMTKKIGDKVNIVGDDLFVTNSQKLESGIENKLANAVLIKMNQIGTLGETLHCIDLANKNNFTNIISHRSGETEDTTIAHLAVATGAPYLKAGAISRTDRVCKYNELLRIQELL